MNKLNFLTTHNTGVSQIALKKEWYLFWLTEEFLWFCLNRAEAAKKASKKHRNPLYHKDFRLISFSAARHKTKTAPCWVLFLFSLFIRLKFLTGIRHGQKRLNHCETAIYGWDYLYLSRTALYSGFFRSSARLPFVAPVRQSMLYLRMFRRVSSE